MARDLNCGAKDELKKRWRIRNARKPSAMEICVLGFQGADVPVSNVRVPDRKEERRGVER